ncbi:MAG: hypothetical protein A2Z95_02390 [Gallionellales bacterium GWA2_60_18]|nr:MAG: hypothetical protein A2Z95_02390 [Gallionellales bacterium GWA2_60_18]
MTSFASLRHALGQLDSLPSVPHIALKILSLKINTDAGERALLELIGQDPLILAKVVGLSNSALFGRGRKIVTLHDATALIGIRRIKMIALSFAMMSSMARKQPGLLNIQNLWQHSLAVAVTMDALSRYMPAESHPADDEIYLAGLLHDIGFMVLDYLDTRLSDRFHARMAAEPERPVEEIEAEMLEMNHCELGAELGRHWNLPEGVIAVLRYHHTPSDPRAAVGQPLVDMAHLAEKLLPTFGISESVRPGIDEGEWRALGIDPERAAEIMAAVENNIR